MKTEMLSNTLYDRRNFLGIEPAIARKNLQRMNTTIEEIANRYGQLVDLHVHFRLLRHLEVYNLFSFTTVGWCCAIS
jgi:hypothetical protein